ncbi:hypothetical protein [Stenotrophomonas sp.]|uniref:hypothetical protein n=1 Tax=Stenotrophomonas sp. TaxID=69392 RepID=UPI002899FD92|nr:hypothetical protein [Stenotrophomonas sp.]
MATSRTPLIIIAVALALGAGLAWRYQVPSSSPAPVAEPIPSQPALTGTTHTATTAASSNLFHQFGSLKQRAQAGDAVAQRQIAELYHACLNVNGKVDAFLELHSGSPFPPGKGPEDLMETLAQARVKDCAQIDGGTQIPWEQVRIWYGKAASNGDLAARIRELFFDHRNGPSLDAEQAERLIEEVIASQDPAAVYAYGDTMEGRLTENLPAPWQPLVEGREAGRAWRLAACRMGYDCGPNSLMYANLCLHALTCGVGTYEEVLRSGFISEEARAKIEPQLDLVMSTLHP